jgi:translocon-associated protein subunit delta
MSSETVIIVDFTLQCKNSPKDLNLYAEFLGRSFPASQTLDGSKFQVSFTAPHKKLPPGQYKVRFFDDDLYSELRKGQRSGEDTSKIKTLFDIDFSHQGASYGLWVQTEHIAAAVAALVCYFAYTTRSNLQS